LDCSNPYDRCCVDNDIALCQCDADDPIGSEQPVQVHEVSLAKTLPFVQEENEMVTAFNAIAEKLMARRNIEDSKKRL